MLSTIYKPETRPTVFGILTILSSALGSKLTLVTLPDEDAEEVSGSLFGEDTVDDTGEVELTDVLLFSSRSKFKSFKILGTDEVKKSAKSMTMKASVLIKWGGQRGQAKKPSEEESASLRVAINL